MSNKGDETKAAVLSGPDHTAFVDGLNSGRLRLNLDSNRIASQEIYPHLPKVYVWQICLRFILYPLAVAAALAGFLNFELEGAAALGFTAVFCVRAMSWLIRGLGERSVRRRMLEDPEFYSKMIDGGFAKIEQSSGSSGPLPPYRMP